VKAFRLAEVQYRTYPASNPVARGALNEALSAITAVLAVHPHLTLSFNGVTVTVNDVLLRSREARTVIQDIAFWMADGALGCITINREVEESELSSLLVALADMGSQGLSTLFRIQQMALPHIHVAGMGAKPLPSNTSNDSSHSTLVAPPPDQAGTQSYESSDALLAIPYSIEEFTNLDSQGWDRLTLRAGQASDEIRRALMENLTRYLRKRPAKVRGRDIDRLLSDRLEREAEPFVLQATVFAAEARLSNLIAGENLDGVVALLRTITKRLVIERDPEKQRVLRLLREHVSGDAALRELIERATHEFGKQESAREVVNVLGDASVRPLVDALKATSNMEERQHLTAMLRGFGEIAAPVLADELRFPNPWYVYRNLLQVLAEVGTHDTLKPIAEKLRHPDPRVRKEAIVAAARIAGPHAAPYLLLGMADPDADVRARAASFCGICRDPQLILPLLALLDVHFLRRRQPDDVQASACLALGQFSADAIRASLLRVLHPPLLLRWSRSDAVRASAAISLAGYLDHADVQTAIHRAAQDRSHEVRQAVQSIQDKHPLT
jgi:HEAT repeat protein